MVSKRPRSSYGVEFVSAERAEMGQYARKFLVRWRDADGVEHQAKTRGTIFAKVLTFKPGDRVSLIMDGRGSIIGARRED